MGGWVRGVEAAKSAMSQNLPEMRGSQFFFFLSAAAAAAADEEMLKCVWCLGAVEQMS